MIFAVDLKYITASQIVCVSYEGVHRRFSISSLLPMGRNRAENDQDQGVTPQTDDRLAQGMVDLTIEGSSTQPRRRGRPDIWLVDWDTAVSIVPPKPKSIRASAAQAQHQGHRVNIQSLNTGPLLMIPSQMLKAYHIAPSPMHMHPLVDCTSKFKRSEI